jgi:hypothetical protein
MNRIAFGWWWFNGYKEAHESSVVGISHLHGLPPIVSVTTITMTRNICITAVDGHTGFTIAELILKHRDFSRKVDSVVGLTLDPDSKRAQELKGIGATLVKHVPGRLRSMTKSLKDTGCDVICVIPPAHKNKFAISEELVAAAKKAGIPNVCLISSAGCDYADPRRQPRLREFIDLEAIVLEAKGDATTSTGGSPCVIR